MSVSTEDISTSYITKSNVRLTDTPEKTWREKSKGVLKLIRNIPREITVEPCLFIYMMCTNISSLAVQNMHLEKSCRVNLNFGDVICDQITARNTTGLEDQLDQVSTLVAKVQWKFPLQTAIPAVMALFVGAWSDINKKRKICIIVPFIGEIITNIGLLLATYYFYEISLIGTVLIEALPPAFTGSYIIIFMGMSSFITDRTTVENRTFRLGLVSICATLGNPVGTALSGVLLRSLGYYGVFSLLLVLHSISFVYSAIRLEDILPVDGGLEEKCKRQKWRQIYELVGNTVMVTLRPRAFRGRLQIFLVILLYFLMVGPLYGDSHVGFLYTVRKFQFTEVEYSLYSTATVLLSLIGTVFCITVLSKKFHVQDSIIGILACVSRIAACFVFALAPTKPWFYLAPLVNIFGYTGLTAVRAIATKSVPADEVAKLSALIGVSEALAPSVYIPTAGLIYAATIKTFPGAFYMFDMLLTVFAVGLFIFVYVLVKRRNRNLVHDASRKEEFARTNEVIRY